MRLLCYLDETDITRNKDGSTVYEGLWEEVEQYAQQYPDEFAGRRVTLLVYTEGKAQNPVPDVTGE